MKLKNIKAYGFKSFADKIEIDVQDGITVIVGPNGSGKSNIVDAVRWVLGEQSVKALRGTNKMTDVIFMGSKNRDPLTRAVVTLTFDNSDHYFNSEFNEIEIKRTVYKTGENEYYLNNSEVRLKDITDLFTDSGAGKESINIISQGKIIDIINEKPEDRRSLIEEAAGVLKYKIRKETTLRKLEKTKDNLERITLIINELELQVEPLRRQSEIATRYNEIKSSLENIEVALISNDIFNITEELKNINQNIDKLNESVQSLEGTSNKDIVLIEKLKVQNLTLEEKITKLNSELLNTTEELSNLEFQKQVAKERQKYEVDDAKLQNNIVNLKESELSLTKKINILNTGIEELSKLNQELATKSINYQNDFNNDTAKKNTYLSEYSEAMRKHDYLTNKINILENNLESNETLPYAVKSVINNPRLKGIHGVLGKLIDMNDTYATAIETALGFNINVVVIDNEILTKEAVLYLRENKLGRATFFPLNVIKPRGLESFIVDKIKNEPGFIDIASNLVTYNSTYYNIVTNQLGNVIVVKDIDAMNKIGRLIDFKYRVVTLNGEILHSGGAITGGSSKSTNGIINQRFELVQTKNELENNKLKLDDIKKKLSEISSSLELLENNRHNLSEKLVINKETLNQKRLEYEEKLNELDNIKNEIKGTKNVINQTVSEELENILEKFYKKSEEKEKIELNLNKLKDEKNDLVNEINELELNSKKQSSEYNKIQNDLKELEIKKSRYDVRLDTLLNTLNEEYNLTYEKAHESYSLDIEETEARKEVNSLKQELRSLGVVNLGSIAEFERVNTRYTFLTNQREDLNNSITNLNEIINNLDETMIGKFKETFDIVNNEFKKVFKELFKGGNGSLILTDPDNLLETGINIIAEPPGKKLSLISLLSGGEMTLTAIALLFSILNIKKVPFCILDEVEANLDEANVDMFGKYIKDYNGDTQFIIITHKKRTMEYADNLYGITMQESGVSKLVSVHMNDVN